ncbi:hypothetical protein HG536_0C01320 [Torulaspora globosa]|uniref:TBP-associated factor 12 n=1 Tax=Torulaspora globosa TaxID=48254 RepID=A0A7G3ZEM8_9SACH|nr:uncharacterized protein HG536_0C01320 [Torulaspora globosa]QLL31964.1 hypothetical protein HG536_0C01320 [Torulaspora globosa]
MSFNGENANNVTEEAASQGMSAQQRQQLLELTTKFKALVNEAKSVGENTPRGKELLMKASRIKAIYDNYNRQRQQAAQAFSQGRNGSSGGATSSSGSPGSAAGSNTVGGSSSSSSQQARGGGSQLANIIKQVLTPEQNQQHEALSQNFQERANKIRDKHTFLKQHIERLNQEVNKQTDPAAKKQLEDKKAELTNNLKMLNMEYSVLQQEFQNGKKKFYVECARHNPALQRLLQRSTQQQRMAQQQQPGQPPASGATATPATEGRPSSSSEMVGAQLPAKNQPETPSNVTTQKLPQQPQSSSQRQSSTASGRAPSQVTNVNAAASLSYNNGANRSAIFKQTDPVVPISETVTAKAPSPVTYKTNRPTLTSGTAMNAAALNTPTMTKLPPYEVDTERVMSKRKLRELVKTVGIDEGDGETVIDGDVESLLLDLADDFVSNVTSFACRLAKHRKSDSLDTRDIQLHLERNWNIRIPGYSADEIRSSRKSNPKPSYNQKLQAINSDKAASMKSNPSGKSAHSK